MKNDALKSGPSLVWIIKDKADTGSHSTLLNEIDPQEPRSCTKFLVCLLIVPIGEVDDRDLDTDSLTCPSKFLHPK